MILPIYKPAGPSSYDIIREFRKRVDNKYKIGHAGTLDPFASGVLILLLNDSTKLFAKFQSLEKVYTASVRLGLKSDTLDIEGEINKGASKKLRPDIIRQKIQEYRGEIIQKIPYFSAAKHKGKPLYKYAAQGKTIEKTKQVFIKNLELISYKHPIVSLKAVVGSGTYIRQLCVDIFKELKNDAILFTLVRESIGPITISDACKLQDLSTEKWKVKMIDPSEISFPQ